MKTSDTKPVRPFEKLDGPVVPKKGATQESAEAASVRVSNASESVSQSIPAAKSMAVQAREDRVNQLAQEYQSGSSPSYNPVDLAKAISDDAELTAKLSSLLLG